MTLEIRNLNVEEIATAELLTAQAFGSERRHNIEEAAERSRLLFPPEWYLGAFEDGELTSVMRVIPEEMYLNGGRLGFGAVSPVANSPLHRRKGHSGAMLRRSLEQMRERGQVLSGLYTPHPAFYRHYGWEIASEWRTHVFKPKDFALLETPSHGGRFSFLPVDEWRSLQPLHDALAARANGSLRRSETWWRTYVADTPWRPGTDVVLWQTDAGVPEGYAVYQQPSSPGIDHPTTNVYVRELVANSRDAYLNLLTFFGRHDIHNEIMIQLPPDDPFPLLFRDVEKLRTMEGFAVLLRVIDFQAAMQARRPAHRDDVVELTLRLTDDSAPWNEGIWRIGVGEGRSWAERAQGEAELTLSARVLAPLFNGYLTPAKAFDAGLLDATSPDVLKRASRIFGVTRQPFFRDHF